MEKHEGKELNWFFSEFAKGKYSYLLRALKWQTHQIKMKSVEGTWICKSLLSGERNFSGSKSSGGEWWWEAENALMINKLRKNIHGIESVRANRRFSYS